MDFNAARLRQGEKIAGACAVALFIDMFLNWYKPSVRSSGVLGSFVKVSGVSAAASAWDAFGPIKIILLVTILVTLGMVLLTGMQRTVALPVTAAVIAAVLGALSTLLVLYRDLISKPGKSISSSTPVGNISVHLDTQIFAWLGLLLCAGLTYGCYRSMREEGVLLDDARAQNAGALEGYARPAPPARAGTPPGGSASPSGTPPQPPPPGAH